MAQPTYPSNDPITETEGGVTQLYDQWKPVQVNIHLANDGKASLTTLLMRSGTDANGNSVNLTTKRATYYTPDVLADANLAPSAVAFITALFAEAATAGVIV